MVRKELQVLIKKSNIIILLLTLSTLIFVAVYFYYQKEKETLFYSTSSELKSIAELKQLEISSWFRDELSDAEDISENNFLSIKFSDFLKTPSKKIENELKALLNQIKIEHNYSDVVLLTTDLEIAASTNNSISVLDSNLTQLLLKVHNSKKTQASKLLNNSKYNSAVNLCFAAPILNTSNETSGSILFFNDADKYLFSLLKRYPLKSNTAETYLVRKHENSILYLSGLRHRANTVLKLTRPLSRTDMPAVQATLGQSGIIEGKNYREVDVLSYVSPIPNTNWYIIAEIDQSEIFDGLGAKLIMTILVSAFILFIIVSGLYLVYSKNQRNIFSQLYNKEKEVRTEQEKFKITMDSLGEGVITVDINGKVQYMNRVAESLTGWAIREARGRNLDDIYPVKNEETGQKEINILKKVLKEGIVKELANHTLLISKNGKEIPVMDTGAPIFDGAGNTIGIAIAFQDETEKRYNQKILAESEKRYRGTLDNMMEGCQIIDHEYRYVYLNDAAVKHSHMTRGELIGNTMMEVYPGIENTRMFSILKLCMKNRKSHTLENAFTYPDGSIGWFDLSIEPIEKGLFILSIEITERKKNELALRESEIKFRKLVEDIDEVIFSINLDGHVEYISPSIEKVLGYKPENIIGHSIERIIRRPVFEELKSHIHHLTEGETEPIKIKLRSLHGEEKWVRISRSPVYKNNKIVGIRGTISDISLIVKTLEELQKAKDEAEEINRIKSNFFANMSHELRTPFVGIMGYAELLYDTLDDEDQLEMVKGVLSTSKRMMNTLTKILNLSRLEFTGVNLDLKTISLKKIIDNCHKEFLPAAEKKNLHFNYNISDDSIILTTDENILMEILNNLVSNAIIYTNEGSVTISAGIKMTSEEEVVEIKVADTGIGISKEKQQIIWDEFRQVSEGTTRKYQGTGLGLSIVKKYAPIIGAKVFLNSVFDKGSTFILDLPLKGIKRSTIDDKDEQIKEEILELNKTDKRILYVEDDPASRDVITRALNKYYEIDLVPNAENAIAMVREIKYAALLIDINLGEGADGIELANRVKEFPEYNSIPIIAVTAYASEEDRINCLNNGFTHYISKPFMMNDILLLIEKTLS
ncbi:MAG: PAS domain S-box protein [Melioribacteraceae bacterium]|nr:PAS domain S-box protein [Melioribacteraceae bacterium]MCF8395822.1 PAS domain S-box protein [Melioribacteraceae bacterium]MCF8420916.1 PAS domain S-box protein [Melioribacteraceae bacterium]